MYQLKHLWISVHIIYILIYNLFKQIVHKLAMFSPTSGVVGWADSELPVEVSALFLRNYKSHANQQIISTSTQFLRTTSLK